MGSMTCAHVHRCALVFQMIAPHARVYKGKQKMLCTTCHLCTPGFSPAGSAPGAAIEGVGNGCK